MERFDYTLEKYGKPKAPTLTVVEAVKPKTKPELDLAQLWETDLLFYFLHLSSITEIQEERCSRTGSIPATVTLFASGT